MPVPELTTLWSGTLLLAQGALRIWKYGSVSARVSV